MNEGMPMQDIVKREKRRLYRLSHRGYLSIREINRRYRRKNPGYLQKWRKANPIKARQHAINQRKGSMYRVYMKIYMRERRAKAKSAMIVQDSCNESAVEVQSE